MELILAQRSSSRVSLVNNTLEYFSFIFITCACPHQVYNKQIIQAIHIIQMSQAENWLRVHNISQQYKIIEKVGRGTYGTVYKAKHLKSGAFVAIKKIQNKDVKLQSEGFPITALREINLLKIMNHKNIIKMKEIVVSKPQKKNLHRGSTFLIFQYMDHDFAGLFRNHIKFTVPQIKCLMFQILEGVKYLHDAKILHRDIKSANLLLNSKGEVKIADFGLGRKFRSDFQYTSKVVTLWYRAPQLLLGTKQYSEKIDLWSVGCILAQFLIGEVLFKKQAQYSQIEKIYEVLGGLQENNFQEAKNYLHYNDFKPKKPYPKQLNELIRKYNSQVDGLTLQFLSGLLELNPRNRISTEDALNHRFFKQSPLPCKPSEIPKLSMQYHEMFKQPKPYQRIVKPEIKPEEEYKRPPAKYFENERKYSYQSKQYKKDYQKDVDGKDYQSRDKDSFNSSSKDYYSKNKQYSKDHYYQKNKKQYESHSKDIKEKDDRYEKDSYNGHKRTTYNKMDNRDNKDSRENRDNRDNRDNRSRQNFRENSREITKEVIKERDFRDGVKENSREYRDRDSGRDNKDILNNSSSRIQKNYEQKDPYYKEKYDKNQKERQKYDNTSKYQNWNSRNHKYNNNSRGYDYHTKEYNKQYRQKDRDYNINNTYKDQKGHRQYTSNKDYGKKSYNGYRKDGSKQRSLDRSRSRSGSRSYSKSKSRSKSYSRSRSRQNQNFSYSWKNPNHK